MPPEVSVIIVAHNGGARVLEALRSLPADAEAIVVDNASSDGSPDAIARELPTVTLIRNDANRGFAAANNQGVAAARGRLLMFLNDDAVVRPDAIPRLVAHVEQRPEVVACAPRLVWTDGRVQESNRQPPTFLALLHRVRWLRWTRAFRARYQAYRRSFQPDPGPVDCPAGAALLVRAASVPPPVWDESFPFGLEDVDLALRLKARGEVHHVPTAEVVHHGSIASEANAAFTYAGYEVGYVRFLAKHDPRRWHARAYALLIAADQPLRLLLQSGRVVLGLVRGADARRAALSRWWAIARFGFGLPSLWRASRPA